VSACLLGRHCRYDGKIIQVADFETFLAQVEVIEVCPELGLGLGVPRPPIDILRKGETRKLIEFQSGRDLSLDMLNYSQSWLKAVGQIDGFILKARSPSCAIRDAKILESKSPERILDLGQGFFTQVAKELYPDLPFASEEDLKTPVLRREFLLRLTSHHQ
jgi:uncharacterized protein YbbK (DUF523 family)